MKQKIQKKILDSLPKAPSGRLFLAPRIGKSKIIIDLIKRDDFKSILWITPSAKLAEEDIPSEFKKWGAEQYLNSLTTCTWTSLHKMEGFYDLIVLDEEQFVTVNNSKTLIQGTLKYNSLVTMTGTPSSHDIKDVIYRMLGLKVLYTIDINDAVEAGILSDYSINVVHVPLSQEFNFKGGTKKNPVITTEEKNYKSKTAAITKAMFTGNPMASKFSLLARMRAIKNSPSKLRVAKYLHDTLKGRKLIFAGSIAQSKSISPHVFNSKTTDKWLLQFQKNEIEDLVLVNSGGTGFTYQSLEHLILVQADSNKNGLTSQKICRTLLAQEEYKATIWVVVLDETQDEIWVNKALMSFDRSKIINYKWEKNASETFEVSPM